jgi:hypothetical protein
MQTALTLAEWYLGVGLAFSTVGLVHSLLWHGDMLGPVEVLVIAVVYPWIVYDVYRKFRSGELQ